MEVDEVEADDVVDNGLALEVLGDVQEVDVELVPVEDALVKEVGDDVVLVVELLVEVLDGEALIVLVEEVVCIQDGLVADNALDIVPAYW